jgi:hypothetical protein
MLTAVLELIKAIGPRSKELLDLILAKFGGAKEEEENEARDQDEKEKRDAQREVEKKLRGKSARDKRKRLRDFNRD